MTNYSVKDIILRYESEEDEFVRELEQMMQEDAPNSSTAVDDHEEAPPILSVLCSLVDEIGTLRSENNRLKTRIAPSPRSKNVVQRMSAMFENRGSGLFRLRRVNRSAESVASGARERLSTPPPTSPANTTTSSSNNNNNNNSSYKRGIPPIVQPEMLSDGSDVDEHVFMDDDYDDIDVVRGRNPTRRCDTDMRHRHHDHSTTSACTSPSSASSRDPSETMTTSRSSFLDLLGFRRSSKIALSTKQNIKKRRRKLSGNDSESSGMYSNDHQLSSKPPRPASYYRRDESDDSHSARQTRQRKATSFLNVHHHNTTYNQSNDSLYRTEDLRSEKEELLAEIDELKMRNRRLVEQLREKSQQQSRLQCQLHKIELQVETMRRRCALTEAVDRMTLDERVEKSTNCALKKVEDRLRTFDNQMQQAKMDAANLHQMSLNANYNDRSAHQECIEKLEKLQREHLRVIHLADNDEASRRLEQLPTYEALYSFTHSVVRRLNEARRTALDKTGEAIRARTELIACQSALLVTHAQMERYRIALTLKGRRGKRASSFHGHDHLDRNVRNDLNFYLPFKLQGCRVETTRRHSNVNAQPERNIEQEFLKLFSYKPTECDGKALRNINAAAGRIESMMREMSRNCRRPSIDRSKDRNSDRRPISLVETEERRIVRRNEETRRSIKFMKTNSIDHTRLDEMRTTSRVKVTSEQDIPRGLNSPLLTRRAHSKSTNQQSRTSTYDEPPTHTGRVRKLERGFSIESRGSEVNEERKRDSTCATKIHRSQPVSRIRPPNISRYRTVDTSSPPSVQAQPITPRQSRTLENSSATRKSPPVNQTSRICPPTRIEKKSWLERLKGITKT